VRARWCMRDRVSLRACERASEQAGERGVEQARKRWRTGARWRVRSCVRVRVAGASAGPAQGQKRNASRQHPDAELTSADALQARPLSPPPRIDPASTGPPGPGPQFVHLTFGSSLTEAIFSFFWFRRNNLPRAQTVLSSLKYFLFVKIRRILIEGKDTVTNRHQFCGKISFFCSLWAANFS
jgi:hypothetical protein